MKHKIDNEIVKKTRKEYKLKHGHSMDDHKAKEHCEVCMEEARKRSEIIRRINLNK